VVGWKRGNIRVILAVIAVVVVVLFSVAVLIVGYAAASKDAMGKFAPIGSPANAPRKLPPSQ
jgi:hypothetical protein